MSRNALPLLPQESRTTCRSPVRFGRACITVGCIFVSFAISACGGNALKGAADDAVRGTGFVVKSVNKTGDNAGTAVAEADDGSKIKIDLSQAKDAGEFVLDGCETLQDRGYDCTNLGN